MTAPASSPLSSPAPVLADLERAHGFLTLAIAQIRHANGNLNEGVAALHSFRAYTARALETFTQVAAASAAIDRASTAPAGRG